MSDTPPLLIVEDDLALQKQIKWSLDRFESVTAIDRESALVAFRRYRPAVVTMDLGLPPDPDGTGEGFRLLGQLLELDSDVKVIVLTGQNDRSNALRAVAMGAYDFFAKPFEPELLALTIDRAYRLFELQSENRRLQAQQPTGSLGGLITRDPEMLRQCRLIERVASSDATAMLLGESGTGKEVLAQALHQASKRTGKFIAINCAAIPETLLESELFGYERGAFTGASKTTIGKIEMANGGTLMLDEIGDLPQSLQAKLLRFLQERTIERLGGRQEIAVDVRIVCATHQNLGELIKQQRFREDLYYRLAEIIVTIPPLRDRHGDALLLAQAFLRRFALEQRRNLVFSEEAMAAIERNEWRGNVRQLISAVKRAAIMCDGPRVGIGDLGLPVEDYSSPSDAVQANTFDLRIAREQAERRVVLAALGRSSGNMARTAELLGVSRPTLYDLVARLGIRSQLDGV